MRIANCVFAIAALLAATASAQTTQPDGVHLGSGKVVAEDYFYNHQIRRGKPFHYLWDDTDHNSGYSKFADIWKAYGTTVVSLDKAPAPGDLRKFSIYLIVNPTNQKKSADHQPHYIQEPAISAMVSWVHDGGVLCIFANDEKNGGCEFVHLNDLSAHFGITFNNVLRNDVPDSHNRKPGTFRAALFLNHPIFAGVPMIFIKQICTLNVQPPAQALLIAPKENGAPGTDTVMAVSHYGNGLVFAVCDPWFYNEYIDVRAPGLPIDNRRAGNNLVRWLLSVSAPPAAQNP